MPKARIAALVAAACFSLSTFCFAQAQTPRKPMITSPVSNGAVMVVPGSRHALAQPRFDVGAVASGVKMNQVLLALTPSKEAQADLKAFLDRQQDKSSADYHHWLTPEQFGAKFGPAPQDIQAVKTWLQGQGIQVTNVAKSGLWMELSGTSGQMETAFKTQMRQYKVNGEMHIANSTELSIPAALSPVVSGVVSLNNFFKKPLSTRPVQARANGNGTYSPIIPSIDLNGNTIHALVPGDYANIYDLNALYSATPTALNGSGINVGLVARSDISLTDYNGFRNLTGVTGGTISNDLTIAPDPGFDPTSGDTIEATLDAQWAGGVAQGANIHMIVSGSTATTDGVDLSAAFAVDQNTVDVLSVSFGQCEANLGGAEDAFFNSLWAQAATQGISIFVSTGDNGAAGCDPAESNSVAVGGLAVSGLASTPFNTAVGGTEFIDPVPATFWNATNNPSTRTSAIGYIPEMVWNESCTPADAGSDCATQNFVSLESSSGGQSTIYPKPTWQTGLPAAPNSDTSRDLPDVSLTAAGHDGYVLCFNGSCAAGSVVIVGGTSASTPSFAGIMAIVDQALGGRQGLANYALYRIANSAGSSCSSSARTDPTVAVPAGCVFNDVTVGNNSVPGQTGFSATTGYDLGTGLGSVNAAHLLAAWEGLAAAATTSTTLVVNNGTTATATHGANVLVNATVSNASGTAPTGAVGLVSSTAGSFEALSLTPGAGGTSTASSNVNNLPGGTYTMTAHYPGDTVTAPSDSTAVTLTINPESSTTSLFSVGVDVNGNPVLATTFNYGDFMLFNAEMAGASGNGTASGTVTYKDGTSVIATRTVNVKGEGDLFFGVTGSPLPLNPGTHNITAVYSGDPSFNGSTSNTVAVHINGTFGLAGAAPGSTSQTVVAGQTATYNLVASAQTGFSGTVALTCAGAPAGTTCTISPNSVTLSSTATSVPFTVTVVTTTSASLHKFPFRGLPIVFASIFALAFAVKGNRKQLWQVAVVAVLAFGISSCGSGNHTTSPSPSPTPTPVSNPTPTPTPVSTPTPTPVPTPSPTPTPNTQATLVITGTSGTQPNTVSLSLTITH